MVGDILQPTHLLFVLVVALLVLGPKRLPEVAKTLGKGLRDFRGALTGESKDDDDEGPLGFLHAEEPTEKPHTPGTTATTTEAEPTVHTPDPASVVHQPEPATAGHEPAPASVVPEAVPESKPPPSKPAEPKPG